MIKHNLAKVSAEYHITRADNGYLFAADGETSDGNWTTFRAICADMEKLAEVIDEMDRLPRR